MNTEDRPIIAEWLPGEHVLVSAPSDDLSMHRFSAGEPHLNLSTDSLTGRHFVLSALGGDLRNVTDALVYRDGLGRKGAASVSLFIPYLPGARQDRGEPFTAKVVADLINLGEFDHVLAVDPHSPVLPGMLNNFSALDAVGLVPSSFLSGDVTVIAPDAGAHDRAIAVAEANGGLPAVHASKHRDPSQRFAIASYSCPQITTEKAVVIDDICDGGGTFLALADAINMPPENLSLWTTHGIYSKGLSDLSRKYGQIACSDSLPGSTQANLVSPLGDALINTLTNLIK